MLFSLALLPVCWVSWLAQFSCGATSLQSDLKQVIVYCPLLGPLIFLMNNISAWITAAYNKLTMFKLARHLLRTQTNPIPLVSTMECCSLIFFLKYLWYVKLLTPVKQRRSLLSSGGLHRKTSDFAPYCFLCAKFVYLVVNVCLYEVLHFEPHHPRTCGKAGLHLQEKEVRKSRNFYCGGCKQIPLEMDLWRQTKPHKYQSEDRLKHISIKSALQFLGS